MTSLQSITGSSGEVIAAWWLTRRGCVVVERNVLVDADEIDLIVRDGSELVAVEVKTSTNGDDPLEAVDDAKFARLVRAVGGYKGPITRIDLVGIEERDTGLVVRWLREVS